MALPVNSNTLKGEKERKVNRIAQLDPTQTAGKTKQLFDSVKAKLGIIPNLFGNPPAAPEGHLNFRSVPAGGVSSKTQALEDVDVVATKWVENHGDYLFNFAVGQVRDPNAAEDIVQDTLLAALKSRNSFCGRSSERTWLVGILRHKIYDHLRKRCRERVSLVGSSEGHHWSAALDESLLWIHQVAVESVLPSCRIELAEFQEHLEKALGELPPRIAQVFQLYVVEERPSREVCDHLDISKNNLWVMLHRGRRQLRDKFDAWWHARKPRSNPTRANAKTHTSLQCNANRT
jgi:RNA polymerase sigma-70 factor (TIGR02943 family)